MGRSKNHPNVLYSYGYGSFRNFNTGNNNGLARASTQTEPIIKREPQAVVKPKEGLSVVEIDGKKLIVRKDSENELTILGVACANEEHLIIATAMNHHPDPFKKQFALATAPSGETYILENEAECASLEKNVRSVKYLLAQAIDSKADEELISKLQELPQFGGLEFYLEEREVPQKAEPKQPEKKKQSFLNEAPVYLDLFRGTYAFAKTEKSLFLLGELMSKSVRAETYLDMPQFWADSSKGEIGISWGRGNKELRILQSKEAHDEALLVLSVGGSLNKYIVIKPCSSAERNHIAEEALEELRISRPEYSKYPIKATEFEPASHGANGFVPIKGSLQGGFRDFSGRKEYVLAFNKEKKEAQVLGQFVNGWKLTDQKHMWASAPMGEIGVAHRAGSGEFFLLDGGKEHADFINSPHFIPGEYAYYIIKPVSGEELRSLVRDYREDDLPAAWHNMLKFTGCSLTDTSPVMRWEPKAIR